MYTMTSFVGAVAGMIPLIGLIWLNFHWNHRYGSSPWLGWFHIGSAGLVMALMMYLMIIAMLELPMRVMHQHIQQVSLAVAVVAYGGAGRLFWRNRRADKQETEAAPSLKEVFQALEDQAYIYDSQFQLVAVTRGEMASLAANTVAQLKDYLKQFASEMSDAQQETLEAFFRHHHRHESPAHFKLMVPSLKSYVILSKVFDEEEDWVGTVMLMHQAEDEIQLIHLIQTQNHQRQELNSRLAASLKKLEQFGYEEEKDRLLREINQNIVEGINQYIQEIQEIQEIQGQHQMTMKDKQNQTAAVSQGVGQLYKELRQVVRKMMTREKVARND
ncbi:hypothetical protein [Anoxynatronum buryatiense]|uniref:Uncharacterized protein n=1 Tax=Anoxynatronum buryatiense TaxID=489973 RepID=A0AA46AIX2_9CLOT|nr:hypothetical protein [Anoxynatronum buryatiense]SMP55321.1 hypothetical protein SAMN06296020_105237 [Anoxynatronum buryatiense]